ncbi:MAG TPA: hypothetical protein VM366_00080 [Anaerolineae bacterium]|nr:hypothetical protein [Anaerolineae bacterium]
MSERVKIDVLDLAPVGSWYRPYLIAGFEAQARWQAFREWLASVHDELEPLDRRDRAVAMAFEALCKMAELERGGGKR